MQIDRATLAMNDTNGQAFCPLECDGCTGICLSLYMMLTRDERDALRCAQRPDGTAVTRH
ncbi:hypothetical protein [uncultured Tateyamaria sp.]|uniref:hypothetical protein n=1 Tax=uncultured Tateyamaria sp. TaxID=455651 RepID=UPI00260402A5|nr:hypothetical protein [uncultured Tateyamaria sp.]